MGNKKHEYGGRRKLPGYIYILIDVKYTDGF